MNSEVHILIKIVGLGAGNIDQLPLGIYRYLKEAQTVFTRTEQHPVIDSLKNEGIHFISFDEIYEKHEQFEDVYQEIVQILMETHQRESHIVYAVPGHPMVAERTVALLQEKNADIEIAGGQSFLDAMLTAIKLDPINGFQLLDGSSLQAKDLQIAQPIIIGQVYDQFSASHVKLTLMEKYPDEHVVMVVQNAGMPNQSIRSCPLYELDHGWTVNNLTSIYVPPTDQLLREFWKLREIFATLRGENGCPWDKKQTYQSLTKKMIEEVNEYIEAVENEDIDNMIEELGDVLLHVMLASQIAIDQDDFSIDDVIHAVASKMIRRHPHVFGDVKAASAEEAYAYFLQAKAEEKIQNDTT